VVWFLWVWYFRYSWFLVLGLLDCEFSFVLGLVCGVVWVFVFVELVALWCFGFWVFTALLLCLGFGFSFLSLLCCVLLGFVGIICWVL